VGVLHTRLPRKVLLAAGLCLFLYLAPGAGAFSGSLSIHATKRDLIYGHSTVLTGRLTDTYGNPVAYAAVGLRSNPYPYKHWFNPGVTTYTNAQGLYAIEVTPEFNTRYFVRRLNSLPLPARATKPRSRTNLVDVYPFPHFRLRTAGGYVRAHYDLKFSPALPTPIANRRVTWYQHKRGTLWRTVSHDRTKEIRPGVIRTHFRQKLPSTGQISGYRVNACIDFPKRHDVGFGRPTKHPTACPRHRYRT
jgi:hypothetical protein